MDILVVNGITITVAEILVNPNGVRGTLCPLHSSYIQKPCTIRFKVPVDPESLSFEI